MPSHSRPKRIGLLGGTSWESTIEYYRLINQRSNALLGGHDTAEVLLYSFNFGELVRQEEAGRYDQSSVRVLECAKGLVNLGAELLAICSNTGHRRAEQIEKAAGVPVVHIGDATGAAIKNAGVRKVGLVGTLQTMELGFYKDRLSTVWGLEVLVPPKSERNRVHEIAVEEIARGVRSENSRKEMISILDGLAANGAEGAILGCTEIPLLVSTGDVGYPLFDTLDLHVNEIVRRALEK
jgi:aspartate racemase